MAGKKIFTDYEFQTSAFLVTPKVHTVANIGTHTGVAGQLATASSNLYFHDGSNWYALIESNFNGSLTGVPNFNPSTGNVPFTIQSGATDKVANLNADLLDGYDSSTTPVASKIPVYGTSGVLKVGTPSDDLDAANKSYVDQAIEGLDVKPSVAAASTASLTLSGTQTVDGVSLSAGDRILVKDQSTASQNGIYVVASGSWALAEDSDAGSLSEGAYVFVEGGTANNNTGWTYTDATAYTWSQFSGAGQLTAGDGLTKSGDTLNANVAAPISIVSDQITIANQAITGAKLANNTVTSSQLADDIQVATLGVGAAASAKLTVDSGDIQLQSSASTNAVVQSLNFKNTNSSGYDVARIQGLTGANIWEGQLKFFTKDSGGTMSTRLTIESDGDVKIDNQLHLGSSADLKIFHDGSNAYVQNTTGNLIFKNASTDYAKYLIATGGVELFYNGGKKFETIADGVKISDKLGVGKSPGVPLDVMQTGDSIKADFTNNVNANFRIKTSGSNTQIGPSTASDLEIQTGNATRLTIDSSGNAIFQKSGGAYLQLKDASAVRGSINVTTSDGLVFTTGSSFTTRLSIESYGDVKVHEHLFMGKSANPKIYAGSGVGVHLLGEDLYLNQSNDNNVVMVQGGGKVGVGVAPTELLTLKGQGHSVPTFSIQRTNSTVTQFRITTAEGSAATTSRGTSTGQWANVIDANNSNLFLTSTNASGSGGSIVLDTDKAGIGVSPSDILHVGGTAVGTSGSAVTSLTTTTAKSVGVKLSFTGGSNSDGNIIGGLSAGNAGEEYAGFYVMDGGSSAATDLALFAGDTNGINEVVHIYSEGTLQINNPPAAGNASLIVKLQDNTSGAARFEQGSNEYFRINTTNGSESVVFDSPKVGLGSTSPTAKFQINDDYTHSSYGGRELYIKGSNSRTSYDPDVQNTTDLQALITVSSNNTTGPDKPGLILHNDDNTAGGFSPMLLFSKRETGSSDYKATMAGIYARSPLGTGDSNAWIDGELIFATAGAASEGIKQRMVINKEGLVGIANTNPGSPLSVSGVSGINVRPGTSGTYGSASAINNLISLTMPYGSSASTTANAGARVGIVFRGVNNDPNTGDNNKTAAVYGVSEDTGAGYSRKMGLAIYTSAFDSTAQERIRVSADGKLGVGLSNPGELLTVKGGNIGIVPSAGTNTGAQGEIRLFGHESVANRFSAISCFNSGGTDQNGLAFYTGSGGTQTRQMTILETGQVGINNNDPDTLFSTADNLVVGPLSGDNGITICSGTSGGGNIYFADGTSGDQSYRGYIGYSHSTDTMSISSSAELKFRTAGSERIKVSATGQVGINNNAPDTFYSESDNLIVGPLSGDNGITICSGTSGTGSIFFADGDSGADEYRGQIRYGHNGNFMMFVVNANEVMRLTTTGQSITGSQTIKTNANQLRLETSTSPTTFYSEISSRYDSAHPFELKVANNSSTAVEYIGVYADGGGANNRLYLNGPVGVGTTSPGTTKLRVVSGSNQIFKADDGANAKFIVEAAGAVKATRDGGSNALQVARIHDGSLTGNGTATAFTVTHNLETNKPIAQVIDHTTGAYVETQIVVASDNAITVTFNTAPANGKVYRVPVTG